MTTPADLARAAAAAAQRIEPFVRPTPLELLSPPGEEPAVYAKCENLQITGSFKARGAVSALTAWAGVERVVTASTGNHGAAVAYAGHRLGVEVTVYVPEEADASKLANIGRWGAALRPVPGDPVKAERAARQAATDTVPYLPPYNHPDVIAGQGTIGLELLSRVPGCDTVIATVGGGGMISGIATVMKQANPDLQVVGVSPANSAVMLQSVAHGSILELDSAPTLADGSAGGVEAGTITFPLCTELVDRWIKVSEGEIARALAGYVATHHQLIEGSAAAALAGAAQIGAYEGATGTTAVVLCGANIAPATLGEVLSRRW